MELWIRSQDKLRLAKIENAIINYNRQTEIIGNCYSTDDIEKEIPLGEYKTKERTLEVLDEIHQRLLDLQTLEIDASCWKTIKRNINCVYEMPEE